MLHYSTMYMYTKCVYTCRVSPFGRVMRVGFEILIYILNVEAWPYLAFITGGGEVHIKLKL